VAVPPGQPVGGGAGQGRMGEQPDDLGDGERDQSRVGGRRLVRPGRGGCPGVGAAAGQGAVTAQMARAAMTSTACRAIAW
jgi:hypothetical protein